MMNRAFVVLSVLVLVVTHAALGHADPRVAVPQVVDDETAPDAGGLSVVSGLQLYAPALGEGAVAEELRALRRGVTVRRVVGVTLAVPGAGALVATGLLASSESSEARIYGLAAGVAGLALTIPGVLLFASASNLADRADRLQSAAYALPWVAPTNGGAMGGVSLPLN